jgi:hypothetical protein
MAGLIVNDIRNLGIILEKYPFMMFVLLGGLYLFYKITEVGESK